MGSGALALLLLLALVPGASPAGRKCVLSGSWRSDGGCRMVVSVLGEDGGFSGSYLPGAAASDPQILASPLQGSQQDVGLTAQPTFTFAVRWRRRDAPGAARTTAFVGQCYVDEAGEESLHALWLLREEAQSPAEDWKATRIGTSVFTRIK
ncbi:avidin-like [Struthio camelus]|uniref:avidin-like n=1 Tax=Struthio camelus TaxID=8801 RepID=UPI003603C9D4